MVVARATAERAVLSSIAWSETVLLVYNEILNSLFMRKRRNLVVLLDTPLLDPLGSTGVMLFYTLSKGQTFKMELVRDSRMEQVRVPDKF